MSCCRVSIFFLRPNPRRLPILPIRQTLPVHLTFNQLRRSDRSKVSEDCYGIQASGNWEA